MFKIFTLPVQSGHWDLPYSLLWILNFDVDVSPAGETHKLWQYVVMTRQLKYRGKGIEAPPAQTDIIVYDICFYLANQILYSKEQLFTVILQLGEKRKKNKDTFLNPEMYCNINTVHADTCTVIQGKVSVSQLPARSSSLPPPHPPTRLTPPFHLHFIADQLYLLLIGDQWVYSCH